MAAKRIITFTTSPNRKHPEASAKAGIAGAMRKAANHLQAGEFNQAMQLARKVLAAQPQNFDALHLLGVIAGREGRNADAVDFISKALTLKPSATAYTNRGAARLVLNHYDKALADAEKAIELNPGLAVAHCVRGHALTGLKRIEEAFSSYDAAVALHPDYDEAWHHRGNACMSLGMLQEAMASYDRSLAINPANFGGMGNQSMCYLLAGDFSRGWERYEARWKALEAGFVAPPGSAMFMLTPDNFGKPLWDGSPTRGTVLVWPEQGIGDQIIFASMLADLQPRVGKVVLALEERLHPLFARSFPDCEIITRETARRPNNYDFQIPAGGLGKHFRKSINDCIRHRRAFLTPDKARSARLREVIDPGNLRLCGLSWSSIHPEFGDDKSMPLATLRPLLETPGFRFVDLQYGDTSAERAALKQKTGIEIVHLDDIDLIKDIDGLAALIDACDLIVTISNTTAHIAGALGKEVWLMLPQNMGRFWYWQTDRDDTLWYPNVHVVRQQVPGDWNPVIRRVCSALSPAAPEPAASASAEFNRGNELYRTGRHAEAVHAYDRALAIRPDHVKALNNLGQALEALGRHDEALAAYDRTLRLQPDFATALTNRGLCLLLLGRFSEGWKGHDARWAQWAADPAEARRKSPRLTPADFDRPLWDGRKTDGTILVWPEQGIGDCILMASMIGEARKSAARLILAVEKRLHPLFQRAFPDCSVKTPVQACNEGGFDFHIPLGSLGRLFRNSTDDFLAARKAYLKTDPYRAVQLRKTISAGNKRICGLSWLSKNEGTGAMKSMPLSALRPLLETPDFRFVDLQYGDTSAERAALKQKTGIEIIHLDEIDLNKDIDGLAALIDACDVIVTISNTTAHIAGALGKVVWLMLPQNMGRFWYWQTDRDDTLWYPNVHVMRQNIAGDWGPVVERVCAALAPASRSPAVDTTTDEATAQYRRGNKLVGLGRHQEALACYDRALALQPRHALACINRGVALGLLGRHREALAILDRAIELEPQRADAHAHRGLALSGLGRHREALASYDRVLELQPTRAGAHANRGAALCALRRLQEALDAYEQAIALRPDHPDYHNYRGILLKDLGRYTEALASLDRAIALAPSALSGRWNRSLCHLLLGHFSQGWLDYAVRLDKWAAEAQSSRKTKHALWTPADFGKPIWDGRAGPVTLLVWAEQGLGEQILFASMLREASARVDKVILVIEARLHPLFKRSFPGCAVMTFDKAVQQGGYDVQIPMGHLGGLFRNDTGDFLRNRQAYLVADAERSAALRNSIAPGQRRICGLSWLSRNDDTGTYKSMPLSALCPLLETPGFRFVDLQYGDTADERAALKQNAGIEIGHLDDIDFIHDIDGLTALIDACDVIVTVSNTTAHIAGALGKEVWLLLPHNTGRLWHWQAYRDDALWYPNVHVVRQHAAGDWSPVVERVRVALAPTPKTKSPRTKASYKPPANTKSQITRKNAAPAINKSKRKASAR